MKEKIIEQSFNTDVVFTLRYDTEISPVILLSIHNEILAALELPSEFNPETIDEKNFDHNRQILGKASLNQIKLDDPRVKAVLA